MKSIELPHRCLGDTQLFELASGHCGAEQARLLLHQAASCGCCQLLLKEAGRAVADAAGDTVGISPILETDGAFEAGQLVAERYRIERRLGRGGMGEVYQAFDEELLERVALKTVRQQIARHPSSVDRLRQELRLARRLVHPNLCRVYEFGRHQKRAASDSSYFITMELLEGQSLSQLLRERGALTPQAVIAIGLQLCDGLAAVHRAGILHRDIKTSNVMSCPASHDDAAPARVVLLDFGIARNQALEPSRSRDESGDLASPVSGARRALGACAPRLTASDGGVGTPLYMAPEQVHSAELSPRTDLFAVGVVLFELLTAELPPRPENLQDDERVRRIVLGACRLGPPGLGEVLARCLAFCPRERPTSASELRSELAALGSFRVRRRVQRHEPARAVVGG